MAIRLPAAALAVLLLTAGAHAFSSDWTLHIESIPSPARGDAAQPQLSVSEHGVVLSWIERTGPTAALRFSTRTKTGWSEPRTVASGENWFVNWADVPSVLRLRDGSYAAHWLQKSGPGTYAYDVRLSFSKDGTTWTPSITPHSDGTQTEHGFASLFALSGGGLGLIWLDGRAMSGGDHAAGGHGAGAMSLRYGAFDAAGKQTAEAAVDTRVCECCPTAAVATSDGAVAAYRDRSPEEVRDIAIVRIQNGQFSDPLPVHADNWRIPACPVNGPALSARGRDLAIAWFTMKDEKGHAAVAFSTDAGRTFGRPIPIADADTIGRVDVSLMPDGAAVASWIEVTGQRSELKIRRIEPGGAKSPSMTVAQIDSARTSGYPRIAQHGNELLFAWTAREKEKVLTVKTAVARLPR